MFTYPYYQNNYTQPSQDERIWVQNETSAEAYLLAPNGFARLWDSNSPKFYEKRADATGRPLQMEIYEYKRISPQIANITSNSNKLTSEDIEAKFEAITQRIEALEHNKKEGIKHDTKSNSNDTSIQSV